MCFSNDLMGNVPNGYWKKLLDSNLINMWFIKIYQLVRTALNAFRIKNIIF